MSQEPVQHGAGATSLCWAELKGESVLVSSGHDGTLALRDPNKPAKVLQSFKIAQPLHDVACVNIDGQPCALVAQEDSYAKVERAPHGRPPPTPPPPQAYKLEDGTFEAICTRMVLPPRTICASPAGDEIVVAGDDDGIKIIGATQELKVLRTLRGAAYIRSVAYDPDLSFLAAATADGLLAVWDMQTGKQLVARKRAVPKIDPKGPRRNGIAFHPDGGSLLAAPSPGGDVVLYERLSWEESCSLAGRHDGDVDAVAFSPNGLYLATGGTDAKLVVWDVAGRKALATRNCAAAVCCVAWHPTLNALAWGDVEGGVGLWREAVPGGLLGPAAAVDAVPVGGVASLVDDAAAADGSDEDEDMDQGSQGTPGGASASAGAASSPAKGPRARRPRPAAALPAAQAVVQPGSTPMGEHQRRFLTYNQEGCITCKWDESVGINIIEVAFHDTSKHKRRVPLFNDFYGITMASLGTRGALYASPTTDDAPSTILYRPFAPWASNSDWMMQLPRPEQAICVAAGAHFCAVATDAGWLRLWSEGGAQLHVSSLPGPVVAMAANDALLAVVTAAAVQSTSDMALHYTVLDVAAESQLHQGPLPLTPGTSLTWLGFADNSPLLAAQDSRGCLRLRSPQFGGVWVPIFDATLARKGSEAFWVAWLGRDTLSCVVCPAGGQPQVQPRPVVTQLPLHVPVLDGGLQDVELESTIVRESVWLHHARQQVAAAQLAGEEAAPLEFAELAGEVAVDKLLLKMLHAALKGDRLQRGYEATARLNTVKSLEGAMRLANHMRAAPLAERIAQLLEARLAEEAEGEAAEEAEGVGGEKEAHFGSGAGVEVGVRGVVGGKENEGGGPQEGRGVAAGPGHLGRSNAGNKVENIGKVETKSSEGGKRKQQGSANPFARKIKAPKT